MEHIPWPRKPIIYEVNTRIWLADLKEKRGREIRLSEVPDDELDHWVDMGFHAIWLMGVWRTSPYSKSFCRANADLKAEAQRLLGDVRQTDVDASVYAVADYRVDEALGGNDALTELKSRMAARGLLLVLDFVPNHLATDHPWVTQFPKRFIQADGEKPESPPDAFFSPPGSKLSIAHGRDPHFPPWTDTAQLNYFLPEVHHAMGQELSRVAALCDGVRCDMAMLLVPHVFSSVWSWASKDGKPAICFWDRAIDTIKADRPDFKFLAEVYWGIEEELQEKGFDYTYDKALYDHLVSRKTTEIHTHLGSKGAFHERTMRFIENHDEPRAASVFGRAQGRMAAALTLTLPGATLIHRGQERAWQKKLPVQLRRRPPEPNDMQLEQLYQRLIQAIHSPLVQDGKWEPLVAEAPRRQDILTYQWTSLHHQGCLLFVANLTPSWQEGCIHPSVPGGKTMPASVKDVISGDTSLRPGVSCTRVTLPFRLPSWGFRLVEISSAGGLPGNPGLSDQDSTAPPSPRAKSKNGVR